MRRRTRAPAPAPIGSFAARGRLSVEALRHYDELGLLLPRHVDLRTGYRYFDPSQAPTALAIALLRSLDVPLAAIRDVLAAESGDAVAAVLERERERRALCLLPASPGDRLTLVLCTPITDAPTGERVLTLPAATVAVTRHGGPYEEIGLADLALHAWAEERGLEPSGPIRELYRNDPAAVAPEALVTDVMLPVTPVSARTPGGAAGRR